MDKPHAHLVDDYLNGHARVERVKTLAKMRENKTFLPISLSEDLLCLELSIEEKQAILETTHSSEPLAYEHFLTQSLLTWPQELSTTALRLWSAQTEHLLWYRLVQLCESPLVPQRVRYTVLDNGVYAGGERLLQTMNDMAGLDEMSPAFQSLLFIRAVQWNKETPKLTDMCRKICESLHKELHPENKSLPAALTYLARFAPQDIKSLVEHQGIAIAWRDLLKTLQQSLINEKDSLTALSKCLQKSTKGKPAAAVMTRFLTTWQPLWLRHNLPEEIVASALQLVATTFTTPALPVNTLAAWEILAGIPASTLLTALMSLKDDEVFAPAVTCVGGLLPMPAAPTLLEHLKNRLGKTADPAALLAHLPLNLRLELTDTSSGAFSRVKAEEQAMLSGKNTTAQVFIDQEESSPSHAARKQFFNVAYRDEKNGFVAPKIDQTSSPTKADDSAFWNLLLDAWTKPASTKLAALAASSRPVTGVFRLCYLNTLGQFKGHDEAALKLLDFTRSKEDDDMRALVQALGGIGTPRATQELISALTRPNITSELQIEICSIIKVQELDNLQKELHSAINDLVVEDKTADSNFEIREAIASLLVPGKEGAEDSAPTQNKKMPRSTVVGNVSDIASQANGAISDQQLDHGLSQKIPHYRQLSSEVKRALRTSLFFHMQVSSSGAPGSIDLSPVIDMQYKALELLFREGFEEACSRVIQTGQLQRRLDVLGYARPIPRAMDEFENYIATLPIVRDIPFFSKFKLRKMLRAICQFRPGKRFTLDGLKAFSLFFLCFSRLECRYGLAGQMPIGFATDSELFEFSKLMHILQDARNRAAHEGFHPDASNDIDGIWRSTAEIIQTMYKVKAYLEGAGRKRTPQTLPAEHEYAPRNVSQPVIEKKVS